MSNGASQAYANAVNSPGIADRWERGYVDKMTG
jgi:hypothetical protein